MASSGDGEDLTEDQPVVRKQPENPPDENRLLKAFEQYGAEDQQGDKMATQRKERDPVTVDRLLDTFKTYGTDDQQRDKRPQRMSRDDDYGYMNQGMRKLDVKAPWDRSETQRPRENIPIPRISIFYGDGDRGEVSYLSWRYEVRCLLIERTYSEEQIALGVRRSCKGEAANILRRLGIRVELGQILKKFESTFGEIETSELVLKRLYACQQEPNETLVKYCGRLEDIYAQAVEMDAISSKQETVLLRVFYQGLRQPLKQMANYKFETAIDYDRFKIEVRKLESEFPTTPEKGEKQKCLNINSKGENSELDEIKGLLQKLNNKVEKLEREQERVRNQNHNRDHQSTTGASSNYQRETFRPQQQFGVRGRGTDDRGFRGRGYQQNRPLASGSFQPQCYNCRGRGHIARRCPRLN